MSIRNSFSFYFAIVFCNFFTCLLLFPYFELLERPGIWGAFVGALTMVIPFGIVAELLSAVRLSSLFEGSIGKQIARGIATQVVSITIGISLIRLIRRFLEVNNDVYLVPIVFALIFGSIAIANTVVRAAIGRGRTPGSNTS